MKAENLEMTQDLWALFAAERKLELSKTNEADRHESLLAIHLYLGVVPRRSCNLRATARKSHLSLASNVQIASFDTASSVDARTH